MLRVYYSSPEPRVQRLSVQLECYQCSSGQRRRDKEEEDKNFFLPPPRPRCQDVPSCWWRLSEVPLQLDPWHSPASRHHLTAHPPPPHTHTLWSRWIQLAHTISHPRWVSCLFTVCVCWLLIGYVGNFQNPRHAFVAPFDLRKQLSVATTAFVELEKPLLGRFCWLGLISHVHSPSLLTWTYWRKMSSLSKDVTWKIKGTTTSLSNVYFQANEKIQHVPFYSLFRILFALPLLVLLLRRLHWLLLPHKATAGLLDEFYKKEKGKKKKRC